MPEKIPLNESSFPTTNTKLAAALVGLGFFLMEETPTINVYSKEKPHNNEKKTLPNGDPNPRWKSGEVVWRLHDTSKVYEVKIADALREWERCDANTDLENLLRDLIKANGEEDEATRRTKVAELGTKALQLLPLAYLVAMRTFAENRERLAKIVRDPRAKEFNLKRRGTGFSVVDRNLPQHLKDKLS